MSSEAKKSQKADAELAKFIEDAIANSGSNTEALAKVIEFEKGHRGLVGFHMSAPLDVMCGMRKIDDPKAEAENMAHDMLCIKLEAAKGELKEVDATNEVL